MKVKISEVVPFHSVYINRVKEMMELMELADDYLFLDDVFPVIQVEKDFILLDGHHRISAMGMRGKKIEAEKSIAFTDAEIEINVEIKNKEIFGSEKEIRWADIEDIVHQKEWFFTSDEELVNKQKSLITKKIRELTEMEVPNDPEGVNILWQKIIENLKKKKIYILLSPYYNFTNPAEWIEISEGGGVTICYGYFNEPYYNPSDLSKSAKGMEYHNTRDMGGGENLDWIKKELIKKSQRYMYIVEETKDALYIYF